jgi:hypothetical protein
MNPAAVVADADPSNSRERLHEASAGGRDA